MQPLVDGAVQIRVPAARAELPQRLDHLLGLRGSAVSQERHDLVVAVERADRDLVRRAHVIDERSDRLVSSGSPPNRRSGRSCRPAAGRSAVSNCFGSSSARFAFIVVTSLPSS
jgi:hypothetical protein